MNVFQDHISSIEYNTNDLKDHKKFNETFEEDIYYDYFNVSILVKHDKSPEPLSFVHEDI